MKAGAVVLAAGRSSRLGFPKQLVTFRGKTLLRHAIESALDAGFRPVVVVLGAHADRVLPELADLDVVSVLNPDFEEGMGSSIRIGVAAARWAEKNLDAIVVTVCDQPRVGASDLRKLMGALELTGQPIAAAQYSDVLGVPAAFRASLFPVLETMPGDKGARFLIERRPDDVAAVLMPDAALDVDLPRDVDSLADI